LNGTIKYETASMNEKGRPLWTQMTRVLDDRCWKSTVRSSLSKNKAYEVQPILTLITRIVYPQNEMKDSASAEDSTLKLL